jgi:hypothetical protein
MTSAGYRAYAVSALVDRAAPGVFVFFAVALLYMLAGTVRAAAERERASAIEQEDHAFCVGLNIGPAHEMYARCKGELADIRRRHEERLSADIGIL